MKWATKEPQGNLLKNSPHDTFFKITSAPLGSFQVVYVGGSSPPPPSLQTRWGPFLVG